ncbi:MAG: beta-phosphoglucomutase [Wenzhouxiangellaceae bacterium]
MNDSPTPTADAPARSPTSDGTVDAWTLRRCGFDARRAAHEETLFALANGCVGVRGGAEEAGGSGGCFSARVYEKSPIHYHERFPGFASHTDTRIPIADPTEIELLANGRRLLPEDPDCIRFERSLDFRSGVLTRIACWRLQDGGEIELRAQRLLALFGADVLATRLMLVTHGFSGELQVRSSIRGDQAAPAQGDDPRIGVGTGSGMRWLEGFEQDGLAAAIQVTPDNARQVACAQFHGSQSTGFSPGECSHDTAVIRQHFSARLQPENPLVLEKFAAWAFGDAGAETSRELADQACRLAREAGSQGFDALAARQRQVLDEFWNSAAVAVDGDPEAELALRFNLFHLFQSAGRDAAGSAAKGLTGDGYEGHCFWDTEAFLLPVLALTAPELARSALEFRIRTLEGARRHAREMNHESGALYPWRTISGDECSGYYPSGSAQYHINAAIAWGIRTYLEATGDFDLLPEGGAEVLFETARLWMQIGHFNARDNGRFHICGVTGPDEYTALVNNNFYTNRMAAAHLRHAAGIWHQMGEQFPDARTRLAEALKLDESEIDTWQQAADAMYLPFDDRLGIHAQDDSFLEKPKWDFDATPTDHYPLLLHYHPLTLYRHQVCKQADVVQALIMDGDDIGEEIKRRCFDYYAGVTTHDSTLSAGSFAILAAELNLPGPAMGGIDETLKVDLENLHGNTDHGLHMAAMAASWQCLSFGLAGLRLQPDMLCFSPAMPGQWRGYRLTVCWRGRRLEVGVNPDGAHYSLIAGQPMTVRHHGKPVELKSGETASRPLPEPAHWPLLHAPKPLEAVIFDLDGVLTDTAELHYQAWKRLADELGIEFDRRANRHLKGIDRQASLELLLGDQADRFSDRDRHELTERKNGYYVDSLHRISPDSLLPGALSALDQARKAGLAIALASASRNAPTILERLEIADCFDFIADPASVRRGKPDPELFLQAATGLGVAPAACLGIEDAAAGITALKAAGMAALGIGSHAELPEADAVLPGLDRFRIDALPVRQHSSGESVRRLPEGKPG